MTYQNDLQALRDSENPLDRLNAKVWDEVDHERFLHTARLVGRAESAADDGDWVEIWSLMLKADEAIRSIKDEDRRSMAWERYEAHYVVLEQRCLDDES